MHGLISRFLIVLAVVFSIAGTADANIQESGNISWQDWGPGVFDTAKKEKKLVILEVGATWCHWCHVMDQTTYRDTTVLKLLKEKYIPVLVDQDAHPDLSQRYEEYGWPAIVIFDANGKELVKHRGYIDPQEMQALLEDTYNNPVAESDGGNDEKSAGRKTLSNTQRDRIVSNVTFGFDKEFAGWGTVDKYLEANMMTLMINEAVGSNKRFGYMARQSLDASFNLIDPVWGGVYQYSDELNWKSPHFEKIISIQSDYILIYSYAYRVFGEDKYLKGAQDVLRYIDGYMTSPDGAFYTSQDADLSEKVTGHIYYKQDSEGRNKLGLPHIDNNVYSNENGRMISSLALLYAMSGDKTVLDRAVKSANWIRSHRMNNGGFTHGENTSGLFLTDNLWMARGMLDLYAVTSDRNWLTAAEESAKYINSHFKDAGGAGFYNTISDDKSVLKSFKNQEYNILAARFFNSLSIYTGNEDYRKDAASALKYLVAPEQAEDAAASPGTLLANDELTSDPLHLVVVGGKDDAAAQELFKSAISTPLFYKQTEWYDKREGKLPSSAVEYPPLTKAAAFVCTSDSCSQPVYDTKALKETIVKAQNSSGLAETKAKSFDIVRADTDGPVIGMEPHDIPTKRSSLWVLLGFAFLGGLILNIMPCVLPILSLKAFALVKKAQESRNIARNHGLAYTGGVIASFLLVAAVLLGLRAYGQSIGWGFQLQSPIFVAILFVLMAGSAANLIGLFELPPLLGGVQTDQESYRGSILTGVLAVAVATPCTAPFMATAVGATLLLSTIQSLLVFAMMGLGMASPFLLISFSPKALSLLPKPGKWMLTFKKLLAIPMALTALWLGSVFIHLVHMPADGSQTNSSYELLKTESYSAKRLAELRAQHVPVLLDADADWCITCKVNERVGLRPKQTQEFLRDHKVTLMIADWTGGNPEITKMLAEYGRNGVPLCVFYPPQGEPIIMPQVLTPQIIINTLKPHLDNTTAN